MTTYELTMIAPDKKVMDAVTKLVKDEVKKAKGEVNKEDEWGEKVLAYPIKKNKTAFYTHLVLTMPGEGQVELDKTLKLQEELLRYLFVRV